MEKDRVCEFHFQKDQIVEYWESVINGQVHKTARDKPKLKENAVPCRNLPAGDGSPLKSEKSTEKTLKKRNERVKILSEKVLIPAKRKMESDETEDILTNTERIATTATIDLQKVIESAEIEFEMSSTEHLEVFEKLYDEAFDVTLPSLLWGIHRDPDKKFIVFSEFNKKTMTIGKLLHISNTLKSSTFLNNFLKSSKMLQIEKQVTDFVSELLEELDKEPLTL
jgi:hypothetical protein